MFKKISLTVLSLTLAILPILYFSYLSYGEERKTTVQESSSQTISTPSTSKKSKPETTTTTYNTNTTTTTKVQPRQVLNEETLKKISNTLCTEGFKAYVGTDKKNICQSQVNAPDIAYSCVWNRKGTSAYAPTTQGPCTLDFTEHRGSILITKNDFVSNPPLSYGSEAQCCYRAAKGSIHSN